MLRSEHSVLHTQERNRSFMLGQTIEDIAAIERREDEVVVTLKDRMDVFNASLLMKAFDALLQSAVTTFIVDLSAVRVVDADGDYPLLHLLKCTQAVGGSVILVCPEGNPVRVFYEMMRLDTLFDIVPTLETALARRQVVENHRE